MVLAWNYDTLKDEAKARGVSVKTLIALSTNNDPFYTGTPGDIEQARWFEVLWRRFGYTRGVHLRRMHYQIVSQDPPVKMPDGSVYENTERCWDRLNVAAKDARYLGYVSIEAFDDRRSPPPVTYMADRYRAVHVQTADLLPDDFAELPDFPELPSYEVYNYLGQQAYLVEIWAEKSTMNDVLLPFCERYGLNLVTGLGELSITAVSEAMKRWRRYGKPVRVFYVSDFDPAGMSMPVAVARKIEFMARQDEAKGRHMDVQLTPAVLTEDQVQQYGLLRTPIKESERRAATFEQRFGAGATELDALESKLPGALIQILRHAIEPYYDSGLESRVRDELERIRGDLSGVREEVLTDHGEDIDGVRDEYERVKKECEELLAPTLAKLRKVFEAVDTDLQARALDPKDYPIPLADEPERDEDVLFDGARDYLDQLDFYKRHQGLEATA